MEKPEIENHIFKRIAEASAAIGALLENKEKLHAAVDEVLRESKGTGLVSASTGFRIAVVEKFTGIRYGVKEFVQAEKNYQGEFFKEIISYLANKIREDEIARRTP